MTGRAAGTHRRLLSLGGTSPTRIATAVERYIGELPYLGPGSARVSGELGGAAERDRFHSGADALRKLGVAEERWFETAVLDEPAADAVEPLLEAGRRLGDRIDGPLAFLRLRAGSDELEREGDPGVRRVLGHRSTPMDDL